MCEIPVRPSRMIHFFPASSPKMVAKVPEMAATVDVLLANLEDGVPASDKEAARAGLVEVGKGWEHPDTQFWTRVNSLDSAWGHDDLVTAVTEIGDRLDVIMIPEVEGPEEIHYVDRLIAQMEAKAVLDRNTSSRSGRTRSTTVTSRGRPGRAAHRARRSWCRSGPAG